MSAYWLLSCNDVGTATLWRTPVRVVGLDGAGAGGGRMSVTVRRIKSPQFGLDGGTDVDT
ncbi:hypothetical protein I546_1331 [Mycobacterium kansasii 732]|nr:hypothetical protein I546_1331 [Mycobacterium kansasii 732]VAZ88066.1 hypothetical protein LAUMK35_00441 [Mycobacterium pseudokansasii]VAZ88471.1 hypothetical protein LAUMK21_00441 [Mycobacterium pseudokansasii]